MHRVCVIVVAVLLVRGIAVGGPSDCCIPNGTPGCDDAMCEALVCGVDAYCCEVAWDHICVDEAIDLCDICYCCPQVCGYPWSGSCHAANGSPGCDDLVCCQAVCLIDPACCDYEWDDACADVAATACLSPGGACCFVDAVCVDMFEHECEAAGGAFQGSVSGCMELSCWYVAVRMDVMPGVCPNRLDVAAGGELPIALVGTVVLPIEEIDLTTLVLLRGDLAAGVIDLSELVYADVATPQVGEPCVCNEAAGDGMLDILAHVPVQQLVTVLELDAAPPGGSVLLRISGSRLDGSWFTIFDCLAAACSGDTDADGVVDVDDLAHVLFDWGTDGSAHGGDMTGPLPGSPRDGIVNVNDLNAVIVGWGACG